MMKSLWSGVNGVRTQNLGVDITANNISNVNTVGFKRTSSEFADIFYQRIVSQSANPAETGSGALLSASKVVYEQGSFMDGEAEFDVALNGKGFFGVQGRGNIYYTRNGEFVRDGADYLVDSSGNFVLGTMNPNLVAVEFSARVAEAMGRYNDSNELVTTGYAVNNPTQDFDISPSTMQTRLFVPNTNMYYYPEVTTQANFTGSISVVKGSTEQRTALTNDPAAPIATFTPNVTSLTFNGTADAAAGYNAGDPVKITFTDDKGITFEHDTTLGADLSIANTITPSGTAFDMNTATITKMNINGGADITANLPTLTKNATTGTLTGSVAATEREGLANTKVIVTLTDKDGEVMSTTLDLDANGDFNGTNLNQAGFDVASASISAITLQGEKTTYEDKAFGVRVYNADGSVSSLKYNLTLQNTDRADTDSYIFDVVAGIYDDSGAIIGNESRGQVVFNQFGALTQNTLTSVPNPQGGAITINFGTPTNTPSTNRTGAGWDGVYILPDSTTDAITSSGDGSAEGFFSRYQIGEDGSIVVQFSNGKTVTVGKLALYSFINEQGLASVGGNNFMETSNSGAAMFLYDENGDLILPASFVGNRLEASNTDLSTELTNLIVMQRGFEASSKSITTSDDMLQTAIGLKR